MVKKKKTVKHPKAVNRSSGSFIHESSFVDDGVAIGRGTKIWFFCHVNRNAKIGKDCILGQNVYVDRNVTIGDRVKIQNNVSIYEDVTLEDEVFCGPSCVFTNVINPRSHVERKNEYRKTLVKRRASIGANATIICGHTIGEGAFIGAGAVVTKDVPDFALVLGNPARIAGWMCECGTRLDFKNSDKATCTACAQEYGIMEGRARKV